MAESPASPAVAMESNSNKPDSVNQTLTDPTSDSTTTLPPPPPLPPQLQQQLATSTPAINSSLNPNSTLNPNATLVSPLAPYGPPAISGNAMLPVAPSFRPVPQFSPLPGYPNLNAGVQPPGVSAPTVVASGAPGAMAVPGQMMAYQITPGQVPNPALRQYAPMPNGYGALPGAPQGTLPPSVS